ncbi:hypothetical protein HPG69_016531 [Diceros bicornis minor]|uniref:Uncharacterized protein n=1 Tax=Diceros bicornis minor TaxID=77932 RepID=A0A7J7F4V0_DICBM|nr:hypothetical protein HPG69_016531 [Diceros bicornis minor]
MGLARKRPTAPRIHNNNCSASYVTCCHIHCGVLRGTETSPAPGTSRLSPKPQQKCRLSSGPCSLTLALLNLPPTDTALETERSRDPKALLRLRCQMIPDAAQPGPQPWLSPTCPTSLHQQAASTPLVTRDP